MPKDPLGQRLFATVFVTTMRQIDVGWRLWPFLSINLNIRAALFMFVPQISQNILKNPKTPLKAKTGSVICGDRIASRKNPATGTNLTTGHSAAVHNGAWAAGLCAVSSAWLETFPATNATFRASF
jgi:hypothetical protein